MQPHVQDFTNVTLTKKLTAKEEKAKVNRAMRSGNAGANVSTQKKFNAGGNKPGQNNPNYARLADEDTGDYSVPKTSPEFGKALSAARCEKGMTQKDLATAINEKQTVIADYENGRAIPNGQVVQKLGRALGCKLPPARKRD